MATSFMTHVIRQPMRQRIRGFWDALHRRVSCCSTAHFLNPLFSPAFSRSARIRRGVCDVRRLATRDSMSTFSPANQRQAMHSDPLISQWERMTCSVKMCLWHKTDFVVDVVYFDRLMYFLRS